MNFDARLQNVFRVGQLQARLSAHKQLGEDLLEMLIDLLKALRKQLPHLGGQLPNHAEQLGAGIFHVVRLLL